jgi:hypothetical protein
MTRHIITAALALVAAACGGTPSEPTTGTGRPVSTVVFSGTLPVGGSSVYPLVVQEASTVSILMASLTAGPAATPVAATVGLALGTPPADTEGCPRTIDRRVTPSLTAQLRADRTATTHCVEIYDTGSLAADVNFAIRIVVRPVSNTDPAPTPAPGTDTFSSILPVLGSASRVVNSTQSGSLSAILTSATPPNVTVGLGLGIPRADNAGCHLTTAVNTLTNAAVQVASPVEEGQYCVRVYDPGTLTANVNFTVAATHP